MFELTLTLTLTVGVKVSSNIKPAVPSTCSLNEVFQRQWNVDIHNPPHSPLSVLVTSIYLLFSIVSCTLEKLDLLHRISGSFISREFLESFHTTQNISIYYGITLLAEPSSLSPAENVRRGRRLCQRPPLSLLNMRELILPRGNCFLLTGELSATNVAVSCFTALQDRACNNAKSEIYRYRKTGSLSFSGKIWFFLSVKTGLIMPV